MPRLSDVPPDRIAGAFVITDGRVHDVPADASQLGFNAPLHALVTGEANERDRRVVLTTAPRFGIVGQSQTIVFRVQDQGVGPSTARVTIRRDGEQIETRNVTTNTAVRVQIQIPHAGPNIVEIEASPLENELTPVNNRAVVSIDGVRDKLRVLLVSGEPHAGERTWRNLLKSDASVDLVHFTILRPPEKQDGTPINELSLIAFPTRELFQQKIGEFHLIIFDRYARQGVLPIVYFDNIARYVREGGAVLIAAGPDYASPTSLWRTPLDAVLPAEPSGKMIETPYHARLSDIGKRHPVTRALEGGANEPPHWSRWFRLVDAKVGQGSSVMDGPDGKPLLVLSREGEGRVALLLSDHIWLWARGFEGGGPHIDLLRRLSHWLMKQPDLEEEALARRSPRPRPVDRSPDHGGDGRAGDRDDAVRRNPQHHAAAGRTRPVARIDTCKRTRAVAGQRRQADDARQCRAGQSARICRGDLDHQYAAVDRHRDRRRCPPPRRRRRRQRAAYRRRAVERDLPRRGLDGAEAARCQRAARHRRAADLCRAAGPAAADRLAGRHLGPRRALKWPSTA